MVVENLSADQTVALDLTGELLDPAATCSGAGAVTYGRTLTCTGAGLAHCGTITGLRPGAWVHRLAVTVAGSDTQVQARRSVLVGGAPGAAANLVVWTVYPRTFVVQAPSEPPLRAALEAAAAFTAANPGPALVTFARTAFAGAEAPRTIELGRGACPPEPGRAVALCFTGSRVVVDALDARGARGAVTWSVATQALALLRVHGSDNVFRGLVLAGSRQAAPPTQLDTVAFTGTAARRNRIEASRILGPALGDAVSASNGAGGGAGEVEANVLDDAELVGAEDKGLKVTTGAQLRIERSCVHDNARGGVQATLGGHVSAIENIVQHNVPGGSAHGMGATGADPAAPSTIATDGNIVRFAGGRGLSVVNSAVGTFANDYVADNQYAGSKVETNGAAAATAVPRATFRGVALACNKNAGVSGSCQPQSGDEGMACATDLDCCGVAGGCCVADPGCTAPLRCGLLSFPRGFGAVQAQAAGRLPPEVWYGDAVAPGRNAFAWNRNVVPGVNFDVAVPFAAVAAEGNQWERCGTGAACDTAAVLAGDVRLAEGATITLGTTAGPRAGAPVVRRISPVRPRRGDLVRVFGDNFNAVEGSACAQEAAPADPCSALNPWVEQQNRQTQVNRVRIVTPDAQILATLYPHAITPTMLAFAMPFDCFAALRLQITKRDPAGNRVSTTVPLCDPQGCAGVPADTPCDDGNACTADDRCTGGEGAVCAGQPVACTGACLTGACDPTTGCVPRAATTVCRAAAGACDVAERCDGSGADCPPDGFLPATTECRASGGVCDPAELCPGTSVACPADAKSTAVCRPAADTCDLAERCDGVAAECPPDRRAPDGTACDDGDRCTAGETCTAGVCGNGTPCPLHKNGKCRCR